MDGIVVPVLLMAASGLVGYVIGYRANEWAVTSVTQLTAQLEKSTIVMAAQTAELIRLRSANFELKILAENRRNG